MAIYPKILDESAGDSKKLKESSHSGAIDLKALGESEHLKEDKDSIFYYDKNFPGLEFIFDKQSSNSFTLFKERVREIIQYLLRHPEATYLVMSVLKQGPIHIQWIPNAKSLSSASWRNETRTISIIDDFIKIENVSKFELIRLFLFEINNANNAELNAIKCSDFENETGYANAIEIAEFKTEENTNSLLSLGGKKYGLFPEESAKLPEKISFDMAKRKVPQLYCQGFSHYGCYEVRHIMFSLQECKYKLSLLEEELAMQYHKLFLVKKLKLLKARPASKNGDKCQETKDSKEARETKEAKDIKEDKDMNETKEIILKLETEIKNLKSIIDKKYDRFIELNRSLEIRGQLAADDILKSGEHEEKIAQERQKEIQDHLNMLGQLVETRKRSLKIIQENITLARKFETMITNEMEFGGSLKTFIFDKVEEENPSLTALLKQEEMIKGQLADDMRARENHIKLLEERIRKDRQAKEFTRHFAMLTLKRGKNLFQWFKDYFLFLHNHRTELRDYFFLTVKLVIESQISFELLKSSQTCDPKVPVATEIITIQNTVDYLRKHIQLLQKKRDLEVPGSTLYNPESLIEYLVLNSHLDLVSFNKIIKALEQRMQEYQKELSSTAMIPTLSQAPAIVMDDFGLAMPSKRTQTLCGENIQYPCFSEKEDDLSMEGCKFLNATSQGMQAEILGIQSVHRESRAQHSSVMEGLQVAGLKMIQFYKNSIIHLQQQRQVDNDQETHLFLVQHSHEKTKRESTIASMNAETSQTEFEKEKPKYDLEKLDRP